MDRVKSFGRIKFPVICALIIALMLSVVGCPDYLESDAVLEGNIKFCPKKDDSAQAVVYSVVWDGNTDNTVFEIPDTYDGKDVVWLGGTVTSFQIETDSPYEYWTGSGETGIHTKSGTTKIEEPFDRDVVVITLKIGKNINYVSHIAPDFVVFKEDDGFKVYSVLIRFECSDNNPVFYSKDGKLYKRSGDELVKDINYSQVGQ